MAYDLFGRRRDGLLRPLPPVIVAQAAFLHELADGQAVIVPYRNGQEYAALALLLTLQRRLIGKGKQVRFFGPDDLDNLAPDSLAEASDDWLLLYNKPIADWMEQAEWDGQSLVCLLPEAQLPSLNPTAPFLVHTGFADYLGESEQTSYFDRLLSVWQVDYDKAAPQACRFLEAVIVADQTGVAIPALVLCDYLELDFQELEELVNRYQHLVCWSDDSVTDIFGITTVSSAAAACFVMALNPTDEEMLAVYQGLALAAVADYGRNRTFIIQLVTGLYRHGCRRLARQLLQNNSPLLDCLVKHQSAPDCIQISELLTGLKLYEAAQSVITAGSKQYPRSCRLVQQQAAVYSATGCFEAAEQAFRRADRLQTGNSWLWHYWAASKLNQGDLHGAADYWEIILANLPDSHPGRVYFLVSQAKAQRKAGNLPSAAAALHQAQAVAASPLQQAFILHSLGENAVYSGDYEQAEAYYSQALAATPGNPAVLVSQAVMNRDRGHNQKAKAYLWQVLEQDRENEYALLTLASLYRQQLSLPVNKEKRILTIAQAEQCLARLAELDDRREYARLEELALLMAKNKQDEVEQLIPALHRLFPDNVYLYVNRAKWLYHQGDTKTALEYAAFAANKGSVAGAVMEAELLAATDMEKSRQQFAAILSRKSRLAVIDVIITCNTWARAEDTNGCYEEADKRYKEALTLDTDNAWTNVLYGQWLQRHDPSQAETGRQLEAKALSLGLFTSG